MPVEARAKSPWKLPGMTSSGAVDFIGGALLKNETIDQLDPRSEFSLKTALSQLQCMNRDRRWLLSAKAENHHGSSVN
jgi:hypothetical protein